MDYFFTKKQDSFIISYLFTFYVNYSIIIIDTSFLVSCSFNIIVLQPNNFLRQNIEKLITCRLKKGSKCCKQNNIRRFHYEHGSIGEGTQYHHRTEHHPGTHSPVNQWTLLLHSGSRRRISYAPSSLSGTLFRRHASQ